MFCAENGFTLVANDRFNNVYMKAFFMGSDRLYQEILQKLQMTEGRRSQVVLLDERRLEILIQPKLYAGELLDLVASHFNLKEKEYFGIAFHDETEHYNWLQLDRRVLEHDIPKKNNQSPLILYFLVKFFIESIAHLRDSITVELFYLQAKSLVFKGQIEADSETAFQLAAHVLQATHGDHVDDSTAKNNLKKLPILPTNALKEHPSLSYCEDKVLAHYRKLNGQSKGYCIVNYMTIVEGLPTYGVHYFEVKDKGGIPWWLGLSFKGLAQYDFTDKTTPRRVFHWKQLENLYFRDRKFSIEVHDPKRVVHALSSFNLYEDAIEEPLDECDELSDAISDPTTQVSVSRRTFGPGNVTVHVWFTSSPQLTRCIWSMAISQHQFYLDRKQNKQLSPVRCLTDIASELSHLHLVSNENKFNNNNETTTGVKTSSLIQELDDSESEISRAAKLEMLAALKARKEALESKLHEKTDELKLLCVKEAELTGELPPEIPLAPGESLPAFRKRVGTAFSLPETLINKIKSKEEEVLAKLELEFEIQSRIVNAAQKLASDVTTKKNIRKQRKTLYQQSVAKLKDIEQRLIAVRKAVAQKKLRNQIKKKQPRPSSDGEDHNDDNFSHSTDENELMFHNQSSTLTLSQRGLYLEELNNQTNKAQQDSVSLERHSIAPSPGNTSSSSSSCMSGSQSQKISTSLSPTKHRRNSGSSRGSSPNSNRLTIGGYIPSSVYQTKSAYRTQQYPTLSMRSHSSTSYSNSSHSDYDNVNFGSSLNPAFRNKYDATIPLDSRGLYSVPKQQTSQGYPSQEELDGPLTVHSNHLHPAQPRTHHSYRQGRYQNFNQNRYGSLDRTLYGTHSSSSGSSSNTIPTAKLESRSLDNLESTLHQDSRMSPSTSLSRDTVDFGISRDYLDCPLSPHIIDKNNGYYAHMMDENLHRQYLSANIPMTSCSAENKLMRPSYLNYYNPEWPKNNPLPSPSSRMSNAPIASPQEMSIYFPHQSGSTSSSITDVSPHTKTKEWYETSLDSPLPPRKHVNGKPPKIPTSSLVSSEGDDVPCAKKQGEDNEMSCSSFVHVPYETPQNQVVVTMGQFQPYREVTKPYELSDYYKYSTKIRKQSQSSAKSETDSNISNVSNSSNINSSHSGSLEISVDAHNLSRSISPFPSPLSPPVQRSPYVKSRREHDPSPHRNAKTTNFSQSQNVHPIQSFSPHMNQDESFKDRCLPTTPNSPNKSAPNVKSNDGSLIFDPGASLADAFHEEMLAWYEDQDVVKQATLV